MEYWIAINKKKQGPMSLDDVRALHLAPDTLVWHVGLPTWQPASTIPELAGSLAGAAVVEVETCVAGESVQRQSAEASAEFAQPSTTDVDKMPAPHYSMPAAPVSSPVATPTRPRTYLGWSIAAIFLCCMIPAIVAVVYASQVGSRYNVGDYEGAQKASERAEMWLLVAVTLGLVSLPFQIVTQFIG